MRFSELTQAVAMAEDMNIPLPPVGEHLFGCCTRDFKPTFSKIEDVAKLIRENCIYLDGKLAPDELNYLWENALKYKVQIVGNIAEKA